MASSPAGPVRIRIPGISELPLKIPEMVVICPGFKGILPYSRHIKILWPINFIYPLPKFHSLRIRSPKKPARSPLLPGPVKWYLVD